MYSIWFCRVCDMHQTEDKYSLSYEKLLYEDIKYEELESYIESLCKEYHWNKGNYFGSDNQCIGISNVNDTDEEYCLFFEEELEGE